MDYLISIIIPTYNRANMIEETLKSILAQSYQYWECLVIDDNSTDGTEELIRSYIDEDPRFSFYIKPAHLPKGPSASRNFGLKLSEGEFVNFLDSDDLMVPTKLETDLSKLLSGNYDFTISQSEFFYPSGLKGKTFWNKHLFSNDPLNDFILKNIGWSTNSPLWKKKSLIDKNLRFDEFLLTGDDYFFHIEALEKKLKPIVYEKVTVRQRGEGQRLENFYNKTPFKLKINYRLLSEPRFEINSNVRTRLEKNKYKLVASSFKKKDYKTGITYICKCFLLDTNFKKFFKFTNLFIWGTIYKITSRGYNFLK